jgi:ethanolamine ammonia-lyase large subunit
LKVNDRMWDFFKELGVIDQQGEPTEHFGDPVWVYLQYCRRQGDGRSEKEIIAEGEAGIEAVRGRGVFLPRGYGSQSWELEPELSREIRRIYSDSKQSIWAEFDEAFFNKHSDAVHLTSCSTDREDYILHPSSGEQLSEPALRSVQLLRDTYEGRYNVQLVISDGLNALSIMDDQQLQPFLQDLRAHLNQPPYLLAPQSIVIKSGRVRAGYQIGELLYGGTSGSRAILHLIGERPGSGHRTFSVYFTCCDGAVWSLPGKVDHDRTKVVAGIANTALEPSRAAKDVARILTSIWGDG